MLADSASSARASILGQQGDELQEQRQEVRQLAGGRLEAMAAIERDQIRHGLAAIRLSPCTCSKRCSDNVRLRSNKAK
jgi:hypothetical protein